MDVKEIEKRIKDTYPQLRIKGLLKKRKETLKEFIVKFFEEWNEEKDTILADKDKVGKTDTLAGCRRSIGDIYRICQYYYPRCTLNQIRKIVYTELFDDIDGFRSSYCYATKKRMFYVDEDEGMGVYNENTKDEFGLLLKDWRED